MSKIIATYLTRAAAAAVVLTVITLADAVRPGPGNERSRQNGLEDVSSDLPPPAAGREGIGLADTAPTTQDARVAAEEKVRAVGRSIRTLRASIAMIVKDQSGWVVRLSGTVYFKRGAVGKDKYFLSLREQNSGARPPRQIAVSVDGNRVDVLRNDSVNLTCVPEAAEHIGLPLSLTSYRHFLDNFRIDFSTQVTRGGVERAVFELTPIQSMSLGLIRSWVDKVKWLPSELYLSYRYRQMLLSITVTVSSIRLNSAISDGSLKLSHPPHATVNEDPCRRFGGSSRRRHPPAPAAVRTARSTG